MRGNRHRAFFFMRRMELFLFVGGVLAGMGLHRLQYGAREGWEERFDQIERLLIIIKVNTERIKTMSKDEAKRLDALTNAIKARFDALIAAHGDVMTAEEKAAVEEDLALLEKIGRDPSAPIPTA